MLTIDEMFGANVKTKEIHRELKHRGWSLTRTTGGHDVFTHPESPDHISVPRHTQLKAPVVMKIVKSMRTVKESVMSFSEFVNHFYLEE
jgi:predicted RNA binding protein YcfA (HicA-like mRNA interferase family)